MGAGIRDTPKKLNDFEMHSICRMNRRTAVFRSSMAEKSKSDLEPASFIYNPHTTVDIEYSHAFPSKSTNQACGGELIRPEHDLVDYVECTEVWRVLGSTSGVMSASTNTTSVRVLFRIFSACLILRRLSEERLHTIEVTKSGVPARGKLVEKKEGAR